MSSTNHNGYVRLPSLIMVTVPLTAVISGGIAIYVNLAIAPLSDGLRQAKEDAAEIRRQLVPRGEHQRFDQAQQDKFADMQRQIDQNRQDIKQIYTPADALRNLNERLDRIEGDLRKR